MIQVSRSCCPCHWSWKPEIFLVSLLLAERQLLIKSTGKALYCQTFAGLEAMVSGLVTPSVLACLSILLLLLLAALIRLLVRARARRRRPNSRAAHQADSANLWQDKPARCSDLLCIWAGWWELRSGTGAVQQALPPLGQRLVLQPVQQLQPGGGHPGSVAGV